MGIITGRLQPGRPAHVARATAAVVALGLSLAACSATLTSGSTTNPGLGGFGLPTTTGGSGCNNPYGEPTGPPIAKVRVANLLLLNGQPAPSYDFYDTSHPTSCDKPLISGLAYGQVSSYVSPRAEGPEQDFTSGDYANLFIFAAGSKTYGQTLPGGVKSGSNITNSGWVQGDQETVVLSPNVFNQEVENSMGSSLMLEATTQHLLAVAAPPSGDGQLVVNQAGLIEGTKTLGLVEIRIDGACTPAVNSDGSVLEFPLAPGSHKFEIVPDPAPGVGLGKPECAAAASSLSTQVSVSAGKSISLLVYGASPHQAKVLEAPIA